MDITNKKPLVFIVEDNKAYRILLARIIEKKGYVVMLFEHGRKAIDMIKYCKPTLILSDIEMPVMNGFELYQFIEKHYPTLNIPFVYISSSTSLEEIEHASKLSRRGVLGKPVNPEELLVTINEALSHASA